MALLAQPAQVGARAPDGEEQEHVERAETAAGRPFERDERTEPDRAAGEPRGVEPTEREAQAAADAERQDTTRKIVARRKQIAYGEALCVKAEQLRWQVDQHEKALARFEAQQDAARTELADVKAKTDRVIAILERLEKRLDKEPR